MEEYADRQAQIWKVLQKYHNLLDDVEDLHSHFDSFKSNIKTNFKHLKEATSCNVQNIQTSLGIQQTYSSTLCSHINIYKKLSELQKHIQHHCMYDLPVTFHLLTLTTKTDTNTIPTLFVIQEDRHCMPTSDYYFTNIQPDPIIIPPHRGNNSSSTSQQAAAKDQIPQQTDTLKPGKTRVYPSMLAEKQVPVLDLTNSTITSEADLQTAFHSLNLCSTEKDSSHGIKQSSTEDTH